MPLISSIQIAYEVLKVKAGEVQTFLARRFFVFVAAPAQYILHPVYASRRVDALILRDF